MVRWYACSSILTSFLSYGSVLLGRVQCFIAFYMRISINFNLIIYKLMIFQIPPCGIFIFFIVNKNKHIVDNILNKIS